MTVSGVQTCLVLTSVAEEVTQFYEDLDQGLKRSLLSTLTSSLSVVLPFLVASLEKHYQAVEQATATAGQEAVVQQHLQAVKAALGVWVTGVMHTRNHAPSYVYQGSCTVVCVPGVMQDGSHARSCPWQHCCKGSEQSSQSSCAIITCERGCQHSKMTLGRTRRAASLGSQ
jgi:O-succinylbenzoate synthase